MECFGSWTLDLMLAERNDPNGGLEMIGDSGCRTNHPAVLSSKAAIDNPDERLADRNCRQSWILQHFGTCHIDHSVRCAERVFVFGMRYLEHISIGSS